MILVLPSDSKTEALWRERAAQPGKDIGALVREAVEEKLAASGTFPGTSRRSTKSSARAACPSSNSTIS